ncbi:MAG: anti-sigma factor family protein [Acidothermaceae bacterium]
MTHLGDAVSALVDGELDAETTRHALAHVAGCQCCRVAVDAERALKARLSTEPATPGLPSGLFDALLGVAVRSEFTDFAASAVVGRGALGVATAGWATPGGSSFLSPASSSRRPPWRSGQAAPRGRGDSAGPGRISRARPHGTYVAAAGLAASVMVGLGGGSLAGTSSAARTPSGPSASTSSIATAAPVAGPSVSSGGAVVVASSMAPILSIDARAIVRTQSRPALSVVYRRP